MIKLLFQSPTDHNSRRGFTVIELVVVIFVIGILAAISIVVYGGVTKRGVETSMQSDLDGASSALEFDNRQNGSYPLISSSANGGQGLVTSPGNSMTYVLKPYGYCLSTVNSATSNTYAYKSSTRLIQSGTCDPVVSTIAGSGTPSYADGTGTGAQFNLPFGVAIDTSGNIYVADNGDNRIRKIASGGVVTTLAGSGTPSFADGTGTAAQFQDPTGVTVDTAGNVYVADTFNQRIRKISSGGVVTTFAGSASSGFADGTGSNAKFTNPYGVAADASGNVYVADTYNQRIRKISSGGVVTTLAGSGTPGFADATSGILAKFSYPYGVAVDTFGNVYVADGNNFRIRMITAAGVVTTLAGSGVSGSADGTGINAQFNSPAGITVDTLGNVYVADTANNTIRKITAAGVVTTLAGSVTAGTTDGIGTNARFRYPQNIALDSSGNIVVADTNNNLIRLVTQ